MTILIYTLINATNHSLKDWRTLSEGYIKDNTGNFIIFNNHLKEYRKNFWCDKHQLEKIIEKAKTMINGDIINFTI